MLTAPVAGKPAAEGPLEGGTEQWRDGRAGPCDQGGGDTHLRGRGYEEARRRRGERLGLEI
jgi:hypothetical protein